MNMRSKALVFGSYMLLPNLLVPVLDLRCLHIVLVRLPGCGAGIAADSLQPCWL